MIRFLGLALLITVGAFAFPELASAQDWPSFQNDPVSDAHLIQRGPGWYFAIWKILLFVVSFLVWVKLADFVNRDSQEVAEETRMPPEVWNPIMVFSYFAGFLFVISFPFFFLGFPLYLIAMVAPFIAYVVQRNGRVAPDDKLFSKERRQRVKEEKVAKKSGGSAPQKLLPQDMGPPTEFMARASDPGTAQANLIRARQIPQYLNAKEMFHYGIIQRADQFLLDFTRDQVAVKQQIDGFWHALPTLDRPTGDALLVVLKLFGGLDPNDRKNKQHGSFGVTIPDHKVDCEITTQGVKTGERVHLKLIGKKKAKMTLLELGMHPKTEAKLKEFLNNPGYVLVSTRPGDGLTTTWNAVVGSADRIMRDFHGIINKGDTDTQVENIDMHIAGGDEGKTAEEVLRTLRLKMPEAYVVPDPISGGVIDALSDEVLENERFVISRMPAKSMPEAVARMLALKPDRGQFAKALTAVLYSRLARRLCDYCKQPYQPSPQLLKKLHLTPAQVPQLYREWQPPPPEELIDEKGRPIEPQLCQVCGGIGYIGRVAIFELLIVDEGVRRAIVNEPSIEGIATASRGSGHLGLQASGLQLVVAGITSLSELQRVLKN